MRSMPLAGAITKEGGVAMILHEVHRTDGHTTLSDKQVAFAEAAETRLGATAQDRLDAYMLIADKAHKELWEALLGARLEAFTVPDLPLAAKLNGWISDLIRVWHGRGPEETSGDSGLKHHANAVQKRRVQTMHERNVEVTADWSDLIKAERVAEDAGCPEVQVSEF